MTSVQSGPSHEDSFPLDGADTLPSSVLINFAHQLNNLLNPVVCYSALLARGKTERTEVEQKRIGAIRAFAERSAEHLGLFQLLIRAPGDQTVFNICEIVRDEIDRLSLDAQIDFNAPDSPLFVEGIEHELRNLLKLFIRCGMDAEPPTVQLNISCKEDHVLFLEFRPGLPVSELFTCAVCEAILARNSGVWEQSDALYSRISLPLYKVRSR